MKGYPLTSPLLGCFCLQPEIMCLFNTYKQLKKQLKKMPDRAQMLSDDPGQQQKLTVEEAAFVATIDKVGFQGNLRPARAAAAQRGEL